MVWHATKIKLFLTCHPTKTKLLLTCHPIIAKSRIRWELSYAKRVVGQRWEKVGYRSSGSANTCNWTQDKNTLLEAWLFWQCYTDVLFCASVCENSFSRKTNIIGSSRPIHIIVIILAIVQGRPTMVIFEETLGQLPLVFLIMLENMVQKYQATIKKCKQLYRWGMQGLVCRLFQHSMNCHWYGIVQYNHWKSPSVKSQTVVGYCPNLNYHHSLKSGNIAQ